MKSENIRIVSDCANSYGSYAEQWKHDEYTKRKNWWKRNRTVMFALVGICCVLAMTALFIFAK